MQSSLMLYDMLVSAATKYPAHAVIELDDSVVTYVSLREHVDHFADDLHSLGLHQGDTVILFLPNGIEFAVAVFAIAKLGAIVVPLNTALESEELRFYLTDSVPKIIISTDELIARHAQLIQDTTQDCQIVRHVPLAEARLSSNEVAAIASSTTVLYQYSSGSTGKPKRVMRTQANLVHEANNYTATTGISHADRVLCVVPLFHAHGFGNCLLATVCAGATLFILKSFNREGVMDALTEKQITIFPGVPFMFSILADSASIAKVQLTDLRLAFTAGAPLSQKIFDNFLNKFGVSVRQLYGSTETGSISINLGTTDGDLWASVGKAMNGVDIRIIDEEGQTTKPNEIGEILIRSKAMISSYTVLDDVNQEALLEGYFRSGDLGKLDENGNLFITGRTKLFINVGANKVDPSEIEAVLNTHPAIKESIVIGVPGSYGDEIIKAVIVCNNDISVEDAKTWCHAKIADFKVPRIVEFCQEIPRSPLGKILRKHLQNYNSTTL